MHRLNAACLIGAIAMTACAGGDPATPSGASTASTAPGCIAAGGGFLQAQLRGALTADVDWKNAGISCEGGPRPDGRGIRITMAGPLPGEAGRQVRFIFGIDSQDVAAGPARALPTNLTVILEGGGRMYATRGDDRCAVETLERSPLADAGTRLERVHARGYCTEPAAELAGDGRLLVPTFEFTGVMAAGDAP